MDLIGFQWTPPASTSCQSSPGLPISFYTQSRSVFRRTLATHYSLYWQHCSDFFKFFKFWWQGKGKGKARLRILRNLQILMARQRQRQGKAQDSSNSSNSDGKAKAKARQGSEFFKFFKFWWPGKGKGEAGLLANEQRQAQNWVLCSFEQILHNHLSTMPLWVGSAYSFGYYRLGKKYPLIN